MKAGFKYLVNPLVGCNRNVLDSIEDRFPVDQPYQVKYRRSKMISRILHELARFDRIRYRTLSKKNGPPNIPIVFIIGHWRSGTSYLHNLLCRAYPASYTTTYHAAFPNNLFAFKGLVKLLMRVFLPKKRPTDAMKMHPDLPQEEELALGQEHFLSFYYWFYFPRQADFIANEFLYLGDPECERSLEFRRYYRNFIQRCWLNNPGEVFISKNPANTARIAVLAKEFPEARFIYLKRDPYETVESSLIFFRALLEGISLQAYVQGEVDRFVMQNYKRLIQTYLAQKELIPPGQLIELSYEELIKKPAKVLSDVTTCLDLGPAADLSMVAAYLAENKDFPVRKYRPDNTLLQAVNSTLGDLIVHQGYRVRKVHSSDQSFARYQ